MRPNSAQWNPGQANRSFPPRTPHPAVRLPPQPGPSGRCGARQVSGPPDVPGEVLASRIPQLHIPGGVLTAGATYGFALRAAVAADRSQVRPCQEGGRLPFMSRFELWAILY